MIEAPTEPGGFAGDIYYGDPERTTFGTHRWNGSEWMALASEAEALTMLLGSARARIADLERQLAEAWEVKPLEWRHEGRFWQATVNALGHYAVLLRDDGQYSLRMSWSLMVVDGYYDTLEAAKAAAQADYTARILSALKDPAP